MATIKLTNGKVTLKNGKPSCECCTGCEYFDGVSGPVIQITRDQYLLFRAGGVFTVEVGVTGTAQADYGCLLDINGNPVGYYGTSSVSFAAYEKRQFSMLESSCDASLVNSDITIENTSSASGSNSLYACFDNTKVSASPYVAGSRISGCSVSIYNTNVPTETGYGISVSINYSASGYEGGTQQNPAPQWVYGELSASTMFSPNNSGTLETPLGNLFWDFYSTTEFSGPSSSIFGTVAASGSIIFSQAPRIVFTPYAP